MNKIKIIDTENKFEIKVGDAVFNGDSILDYKIKRFDGKSGIELNITFFTNEIETQIDLKQKENSD